VLQHHLPRMLAYATVSHVGLTLAGFALLAPEGLAGAVLYLVADGLVKGALFVSIGLVQHHLRDVRELELQGRGRNLPWAAALMAVGALGLAGVPPFGTFLGKALMEEAAAAAGQPWLAVLFVAVAALTSAALLRAAARVFLGMGVPRIEAMRRRAPARPHPHVHATLIGPAVLLLAGAVALGLWPGLAGRVEAAAERFTDRPAYAAAVLEGTTGEHATTVQHPGVSLAVPAALAGLSALLGAALALAALRPRRRPEGRLSRAAGRVWAPTAAVLRDLHSGNVGDSVAWLVVGLAGFGTLLALVAR
jgi:multicomponent Na+:H+ antiporter subunit D